MSVGWLGDFVREGGCLWVWGVGGLVFFGFSAKQNVRKRLLIFEGGKTMKK
jgi:hypothetical protein